MMRTAISLFSSSGIGDIALKKLNYNVLVANELLNDRSSLYMQNYPETKMIIRSKIPSKYKQKIKNNKNIILIEGIISKKELQKIYLSTKVGSFKRILQQRLIIDGITLLYLSLIIINLHQQQKF